jgi:predicted HTH domain antitoxin
MPSISHFVHSLFRIHPKEEGQGKLPPGVSGPTLRSVESEYVDKRRKAITAEYNARLAVEKSKLNAKLDEIASRKAPLLKELEDVVVRSYKNAEKSTFVPPERIEVPVIELSADDPFWRKKERMEKLNMTPFPFPTPEEFEKNPRFPKFEWPKNWLPTKEEIAEYKNFPATDLEYEEWRRVVFAPLMVRVSELNRRDKARIRNMFSTKMVSWSYTYYEILRLVNEARTAGGEYVEDEEDLAEAAAKAEEGVRTEGIMTLSDAVQILGLALKPTKEELMEKRDSMKALNDPEKGGSAFLRDKVHVAADVVLHAIDRKIPFPKLGEADASPSPTEKPQPKKSAKKKEEAKEEPHSHQGEPRGDFR